jgi:hypothetical protein
VLAKLQKNGDLTALQTRTHFAFTADSKSILRGGHSTYGVTLQDSTASIRPYLPSLRHGQTEKAGAPLHLKTVSVSREAETLGRSPMAITGDSLAVHQTTGGAVANRRAGGIDMAELFDNKAQGAEQSWKFAERPRGTGALVVRISAAGQRFNFKDSRGLHF